MVLIVDTDGGGGFGQLIPDHASAHLPGGSDPLTTGAPTTITEGASPSEGDDAAFARQDHVHGTPSTWTPDLTSHLAAADPHTGYVLESLLDAKGDLIVGASDNTPAKLTVGTNDHVLTADSSATNGVKWAAIPAAAAPALTDINGGNWKVIYTDADGDVTELALGADGTFLKSNGASSAPSFAVPTLTHAYIGTNAIGGSAEGMTNRRLYMKKVTLATDGLITSIGAYITPGSAIFGMTGAVFTDDGGSPSKPQYMIGGRATIRAQVVGDAISAMALDTAARWLHFPVGLWLVAGTYWIGVQMDNTVSGGTHNIAYATSGADYINTAGGSYTSEAGAHSFSDSTRDYSIRASFLS